MAFIDAIRFGNHVARTHQKRADSHTGNQGSLAALFEEANGTANDYQTSETEMASANIIRQ